MGYLNERKNKALRMLEFCNYELSNDVVALKMEQQTKISELIENEKYDGCLNVGGYGLTIETTDYDNYNDVETECYKEIIKVCSNDGEVYVEDFDEKEYFIDDIDSITFKMIYDLVNDIVESREE